MTGAVMPSGADTVVKVEDTEEHDGRVWINVVNGPGNNVRGSGEDIQRGQLVLEKGRVLRACRYWPFSPLSGAVSSLPVSVHGLLSLALVTSWQKSMRRYGLDKL